MSTTSFFFYNDTATTQIYTLSLHDALPIFQVEQHRLQGPRTQMIRGDPHVHLRCTSAHARAQIACGVRPSSAVTCAAGRSEEHTSELQSHSDLVCRLLLEKKKNKRTTTTRQ